MSAPRLPAFNYRGQFAYSITIDCHRKQNIFIQDNVVGACLKSLREVMALHQFQVYTYCFMPSHLHLLLVGLSEDSDMRTAVKLFKQKAGYFFKKTHAKQLWQSSFYDHVLRNNEDMEVVARYILYNPVRAGLVKNFWEYKYSGSFVLNIRHIVG